MPVMLSRGERKTMIWMIVVALTLACVTVIFTPNKSDDPFYPSSYSPSSHGGKAAYLLLQQLGYNVQRWERPLSELPDSGKGTVLILARPTQLRENRQKDIIKRYVATGGRLVCFGLGPQWVLPHGSVEFNPAPQTEWKAMSPVLPSRVARGGAITTDTETHWVSDDTTDMVHYTSEAGPTVVSYNFGKGEVIWWNSATPITNAGITQPGNVEFVLNSIGDKDLRVFWNEYSGPEYKSLWSRAWETPVKWLFAQGALFATFLLLTFSRRAGPLRAYPVRSRLSPLEFTETLGALYKRAHATGFALEASYTHFRSAVARKYGIRRDAKVDALATSLRERFPQLDDKFAPTLRDIERWIHDGALTEDMALDLVQRLQHYAAILRIGPGDRRENN
jgi:hypothetical protein